MSLVTFPIRALLLLSLAAAAVLRAQDTLNYPAPLAPAPPLSSPALDALTRQAAQRAQELGFPTVAAELYRELLVELQRYPSLPGYDAADRSGLTLALATALLDDNRSDEAERVLNGYAGPRGAAWHLRAGLAAARQRNMAGARSELGAVKADELTPADRPWYFFLQAVVAGAAGDPIRAGDLYQQAARAATTDLEKARFSLEREKARLLVGPVSEATAEQTRQNADRFQGTSTGYDFSRSYAVMLDALGRKGAAEDVLERQLQLLPGQKAQLRADDFHLLLGLIAGAGDGVGQRALVQLLETGSDPDRRRMALQLLATAALNGPDHALFRSELDKLIAGSAADPILDDVLMFRAEWALGDHDDARAEDDAHVLLDKFPGSPLKGYALSVLTGAAWDQRRYRTAADDAFQARAALPAGEARSELGVVVAEAWYRAGDYPSAADAYAAALREPPTIVLPGRLMFQLVKADIEAGEEEIASGRAGKEDPLKDARVALDRLAVNPAFDPVDRWEAEWNFASALQRAGQTSMAYDRMNRLLVPQGGTPPPRALPPELRARMAWLQARLSLDAHRPRETLLLADAMAASLDGIEPDLRTDIASTGELLKAQACFALDREAAALEILKKLRADFPQSDAAVSSYIVEADHYVQQDRIVEAQQLLTRLADDFPGRSDYAPYALLQAALLAERLGQEINLREADKLIERLVTKYPDSPLVFDARLTEGDLLRKLNDFPKAQQVYESLVNNYSQNPDAVYAELALAECHNAQSASDSSHAETAIALFSELRDRVDAPVDMRVEAGFCLGYLYETARGQPDQAQAVWWRDVVSAFLLNPERAKEMGATGRHWMTRTLIELGELNERRGKLGEAKQAWHLIVTSGLPGAEIAREQLARVGAPAAKP